MKIYSIRTTLIGMVLLLGLTAISLTAYTFGSRFYRNESVQSVASFAAIDRALFISFSTLRTERGFGLTTRRYQSGEVDYDGHISQRGDAHMRGLLYEAATVLLTRSRVDSDLRTWGLKLRERLGFKRAAVAVARKLAVFMHTMLRSGQSYRAKAVIA